MHTNTLTHLVQVFLALVASLVVLLFWTIVFGARLFYAYSQGSANKSRARRALMKEMVGGGLPRPLVREIGSNYAPSSREILAMVKGLLVNGTHLWRRARRHMLWQ